MNIVKEIEDSFEYYKNIRRHLHSIPEIGFKEFDSSKVIQDELDRLGIEYESGIAHTGIVATIKCGDGKKSIAFRADMDALYLEEENSFSHCSKNKALMHACGHDGHVATLLAFAKAIVTNRELFNGVIYLVFQPAEEGLGGAKVMIKEGMLDRYKIDKIFAIHNRPTEDFGKIFVKMGTMMASYDDYKITIHGKSTHSSMPQTGKNPIVAAAHIVTALKSITSLDISPLSRSVVTVAKISGGEALNIIPKSCEISGSIRAHQESVREDIEKRVKDISKNIAYGFGMEAKVVYNQGYPLTINSDITSALKAAEDTVGKESLIENFEASFGAEDFSYFLQSIPGCYAWVGSRVLGEDIHTLHSSQYDFNDEVIKVGASYFYNIARYEIGS
jgi:hippurate hydrolase